MSAAAAARDAGALLAAAGIVGVMVPLPRVPATLRRAGGLAMCAVGWLVLAASLVPESLANHVRRHAHTVIGVAELAIGAILVVVLAVALLALGTWAARRWRIAWLVALAIALPIRIPVPIGGASRDLLLPLYVVGILGLLAVVWERIRGLRAEGDVPVTVLDLPIAAFIGFTALSMFWSVDTKDAAIQMVFFYLPFPLLYLTIVAWWPTIPRATEILGGVTIAFATAIAVLAMAQYEAHWIFWNAKLQQDDIYSQFYRVNGIFYDPNIMGRYLAVGIIATLGWMWLRPLRRELVLGTVAIVLMCGGLLVSFSRSSCLMVMVGIVLLAWRAFGWKRTLTIGGIAFVVLAGGAIASSHNIRDALTNSHRASTVSEGRFGLMNGGIRIWKEHPIAGSGVGSFQQQFTATETQTEIAHKQVSISHNAPITVLAEEGVIGLLLMAWLCVAAWIAIVRSSRRSPLTEGWLQWTLLAIVTGIFVHSQLYADFFEDPIMWTALAAALAIGASAARSRPGPSTGSSAPAD